MECRAVGCGCSAVRCGAVWCGMRYAVCGAVRCWRARQPASRGPASAAGRGGTVAGNWGVASVGRAGAGRHRVLFFGVWRGEHWAAEGHNNVAARPARPARRRALSRTRSHTQHRAHWQDKGASVTSQQLQLGHGGTTGTTLSSWHLQHSPRGRRLEGNGCQCQCQYVPVVPVPVPARCVKSPAARRSLWLEIARWHWPPAALCAAALADACITTHMDYHGIVPWPPARLLILARFSGRPGANTVAKLSTHSPRGMRRDGLTR